VYANLNRTGWWNLTINGGVRRIPPNGLYAYMINDTSFEMFFNDGNLSTWVKTPTYIYLYPKNDQTVTFRIGNDALYIPYVFYGDDSSNGLRALESRRSYSTYTTNNPTLMRVQTLQTGEIACGVPLMRFSQDLFNLLGSVFLILVVFALARILTGQMNLHGKEFYFMISFIVTDVIAMLIIVFGSSICIQ
jgi:hypothetical protein